MKDLLKKRVAKKSNIALIFMILFLAWQRIPTLISDLEKEGRPITPLEYVVISAKASQERVLFPPKQPSMAIFWATWCAPCKVDMKRFKRSVDEGKIPPQSIFAINPFESQEVVRSFLRSNDYPFIFIEAPLVSQELSVAATPTTVLIKDQKIHSLSTGISVIGIWRAEKFLAP